MFINLAYKLICAANDLKHIHTHTSGPFFFTIHEIIGEYYEECSNQADYVTELALEFGETMENPSLAANLVDWKVTNMAEYDLKTAIYSVISTVKSRPTGKKIEIYDAMVEVDNKKSITPDVKSKIEEFMRYWAKENNYKLERLIND